MLNFQKMTELLNLIEVRAPVLSPASIWGSSSLEFPKQFLKLPETIVNDLGSGGTLTAYVVVIAKSLEA